MPGPYGLLSLVNGVALGMIVAPGLPLRPLLVLVLGAAALFVARDGRVAMRWQRR